MVVLPVARVVEMGMWIVIFLVMLTATMLRIFIMVLIMAVTY